MAFTKTIIRSATRILELDGRVPYHQAIDEAQAHYRRQIEHARATERRKVAEEIVVALQALDPIEATLAGQDAWEMAAAVARKHREEQR